MREHKTLIKIIVEGDDPNRASVLDDALRHALNFGSIVSVEREKRADFDMAKITINTRSYNEESFDGMAAGANSATAATPG